MGSICSFCCCCCPCCWSEDEEEQSRAKSGRMPQAKTPKLRYKATDEDETDEAGETVQPVIEMSMFRGGESAYSIQKRRFVKTHRDSSSKTSDTAMTKFLVKNQYELHNKLGDGSYSVVFKITKNNKSYALKVINLNSVPADYKENFLDNELEILKKIKANKSRYIIKINEVHSTEKQVMIVMEYAPNGTLADHLKKNGALTEMAAQNWFLRILDAIVYLHSHRVAHRDLKLENVLLNKKYRPKLSDFSYAIEVKSDSPLCKQFCGTLPYFPPEILEHKPYNPLIADIWSLGVIFFIMLNDKLPFDLNDQNLMLEQQLNKQWKHRKNVETTLSQDLKDLIASMLEPDVSLRATAEKLSNNPWILAARQKKKYKI